MDTLIGFTSDVDNDGIKDYVNHDTSPHNPIEQKSIDLVVAQIKWPIDRKILRVT